MSVMKKIMFGLCILVLLGFTSVVLKNEKNKEPEKTWIPADGFVPNESVAKQIAETVLLPIYGEDILNQKPFKVSLIKDSIWVIEGSSQNIEGGVAIILIQKSDCKILKVTHGK
jgi:hypothetical protein